MAFNNYLEDENDKPYFTTNSLAYYYDKMEGFAKAVDGSAKALNLTKEEVEKRLTLYIQQNKNELDQRLDQWDGKLKTFDSSVETLLTEWVDDGTLTPLIDSTLINQRIEPLAKQLAGTAKKEEVRLKSLKIGSSDVTDEFKQQMAGNTPIYATPAREGVTRSKLADKSVSTTNISFMSLSTNLADTSNLTPSTSITPTTGQPVDNTSNDLTDFIYIKPNQPISLNKVGRWGLYDEAGAFISSGTNNTLTTPSNAFYIRLAIAKTVIKNAQMNYGETLLPFEEFKAELKEGENGIVIKPSFDTVRKDALESDSVDPFKLQSFKKPKNLFNKNNVLIGKSIGSDDVETVDSTRVLIKGHIRVKPNTTYAKTVSTGLIITHYDRHKRIGGIREIINGGTPTFTTPDYCYWIRVSATTTSYSSLMINEGEILLPFEEYEFELISTDEFPLKISGNVAGGGSGGSEGVSENEVLSIMDKRLKPFRQNTYEKKTYAEIVASLPDTGCVVEELGFSVDGVNRLYGIKYGDTSAKPVIFIASAQHGSEWQAVNYGVDFMKRISGATKFYDSELLAKLTNTFAFYQIVCVSPTGYIDTSYNTANNVNLNRNWDRNWTTYDGGGISTNNKGSAPFSEPETQIVRDKIIELKPYMVIDCHTSGPLPGGIDTGKIYTAYRELLLGVHNELFNIYDDADLFVQEWNVGANPTLSGWAGLQTSKEGTKTIPTIVEMNTQYGANYGLTALFALSIGAYNYYTSQA